MDAHEHYHVAIVGGGPAGLSAAILLGRCRRDVIVIDDDTPRNRVAVSVNGYLGREGVRPGELRATGREQAGKYGVKFVTAEVLKATPVGGPREGFLLEIADHPQVIARKILVATGVRDQLPDIDGIRDFYGTSVHHCPYCDGWEHRDQKLVALGSGHSVTGLATSLLTWSSEVSVCTNGESVSEKDQRRLRALDIDYVDQPAARLVGTDGRLERIEFVDGTSLPCDAVFFSEDQFQQSNIACQLGCEFSSEGYPRSPEKQKTTREGIFVAGDAAGYVQFAIVAAAEGAIAATAINKELQAEDLVSALQDD